MTNGEKVPSIYVIVGGLTVILALIVSPWIAIIGMLDGAYIIKKYPHKKIHGIIPLLFNLFILIFALMASDLLFI